MLLNWSTNFDDGRVDVVAAADVDVVSDVSAVVVERLSSFE